jgi:L-ascorbate metabolism protein UlaG (beta-lactamase superfamily)
VSITPHIRGNKVTFAYLAPNASMVNVLGTFNHWDLTSGVMTREPDGTWRRTVDVPLEGSYDYKFIVDGEWVLDPMNPDYGKDHKDRYNSRFQVTTSASAVDFLRAICAGLAAHPPGCRKPARWEVFRSADAILQLPTATHSRILKDHFIDRMTLLADQMSRKKESFAAGVYCHGYVLQMCGRTIGIDVVTTRSVWGMYWDIPSRTVEAVAAGLDALCVSHLHPDHLDYLVIKHLLARKCPVFVPEELAGRFPEGVIAVKTGETVKVHDWQVTFHGGVHVYDERRMLVLKYFELIAPDGRRIVHTTDHDYTTGIRYGGHVDLLIAKAGGVNPTFEGRGREAFRNLLLHVRPRLFIPGHLNELGHPIRAGREPYQTGIEIVQAVVECAGDLLHWGEQWTMKKPG